jgi:hypothetical protein
MNFENYLKDNVNSGIIDFNIRAYYNAKDEITFYIHPRNHNGDTLDFIVKGNELKPKFEPMD